MNRSMSSLSSGRHHAAAFGFIRLAGAQVCVGLSCHCGGGRLTCCVCPGGGSDRDGAEGEEASSGGRPQRHQGVTPHDKDAACMQPCP